VPVAITDDDERAEGEVLATFTTLVTRLMLTTWSLSSSPVASIFFRNMSLPSF